MSQLADLLEANQELLHQRWPTPTKPPLHALIQALREGNGQPPPNPAPELFRHLIFDLLDETGLQPSITELRVVTDFTANSPPAPASLTPFFDLSPDMLVIASLADGRITHANPAMTKATGLTEDELSARPFPSIVHPDDVAPTERAVAKLTSGSPLLEFEHRVACQDGSYRCVAWHAAARSEEGVFYGVGRDVTERRRAEAERTELIARERAARSEAELERQKLRSLFSASPVPICVVEGPDHRFTFANAAYRAVVGGRDLVGKPLLEALPELAGQGFDALLDEVVTTGERVEGNEAPMRLASRPEGELAYFNFVYAPRRDAQGNVDGVLVFASDVTAQVLARRAAETARAELEAIFHSLPEAVYVGDASGITRANPLALTMLGYDNLSDLNRNIGTLAEEIQTRRADTGELIPVEGQAFTHALQGSQDEQEVRVRDVKTGEERVVRCSAAPIKVGGEVVGAVAVNTDITERRAIEEERLRLAALVEKTPSFIGVADTERVPVYVNPAGRSLVGLTGPASSTNFMDYYAREAHEQAEREILPALEREGAWVGETLFRHAQTGEVIPVSHALFAIHAPGTDRLLGFGTVTRDIRAEKRHEAEVGDLLQRERDARELAERLANETRERSEFEKQLIGIVSHDLRNPLHAILLGTAGLLRREQLDAGSTKAVARIQSSAQRATRMIRDLLDFTQARLGGGIPIDRRPLDLHSLVRQAVDEVEAAHPGRNLEVLSHGDGQALGDADRLAQVVQNLVTNALSYSPEGTPVQIVTRGDDDGVILCVHNEGPPIPAERLPHLFEPLQRARDGGARGGRSLGLGLYIVQHIVSAHGGVVEVRSSEGEGTTFIVRLPRGAPDA